MLDQLEIDRLEKLIAEMRKQLLAGLSIGEVAANLEISRLHVSTFAEKNFTKGSFFRKVREENIVKILMGEM